MEKCLIDDDSDIYSGAKLRYYFVKDYRNNFRGLALNKIQREAQVILDIGRGARDDQKLFENHDYRVLSMDLDDEPDYQCDACNMEVIPSNSIDAVLCIAVLEHVYNPFKAIEEIYRVLRKGGYIFGYVPFLYGFHAKPDGYRDYFRYTVQGVAYLLSNFSEVQIAPVRGNMTTLLTLAFGKKRFRWLRKLLSYLERRLSYHQVSGFNFLARK